jgi:hypothetical protein
MSHCSSPVGDPLSDSRRDGVRRRRMASLCQSPHMASEFEKDPGSEHERRRGGGPSTGQRVTISLVAVFLAAGAQSFSDLELLPRVLLGAAVAVLAIFVGNRIVRGLNAREERRRS